MSRSIRTGARAFASDEVIGSLCEVCFATGSRYSDKDGKTLCKAHREQRRGIQCRIASLVEEAENALWEFKHGDYDHAAYALEVITAEAAAQAEAVKTLPEFGRGEAAN